MNYDHQEYEISLKRMLFHVLYQWKKIAAAAVILALVLGGWKGLPGLIRIEDPDQAEQQYQEELELYQAKKTLLERHMEETLRSIKYQKAYLEQSPVMKIDAYHAWHAESSFYIATDYKIMPGMSYQNPDPAALILEAYRQNLETNEVMEEIGKTTGLDARYARELVQITGQKDHILSLGVNCADDETSEKIMGVLVDSMNQFRSRISGTVGSHTLKPLVRTSGAWVDKGLAGRQEAEHQKLADYEIAEKEISDQLSELKEPVKLSVSRIDGVKKGIKWAVLGGVAAVLVGIVAACVQFVVSDRLYSGDEIHARFGVRVLGSLWSGKKPCGRITAAIRGAEDRISRPDQEDLGMIAANLTVYGKGAAHILVSGTADGAQMEKLTEELKKRCSGIRFTYAGSLLSSPEALKGLEDCDGVVLTEKCRESTYKKIAAELERIGDKNKPVVGVVVAEQ